jgi:hypothetical protein
MQDTVENMIKKGAQYYVSVNYDDQTKSLMAEAQNIYSTKGYKVIEATEISTPVTITLRVAPESSLARVFVLLRVLLRMAGSFFLELFLFLAGCCAILSWFIYAPFYAAMSSLVVLVALIAWVFDIYLTRQFAVRDIIRLQ